MRKGCGWPGPPREMGRLVLRRRGAEAGGQREGCPETHCGNKAGTKLYMSEPKGHLFAFNSMRNDPKN